MGIGNDETRNGSVGRIFVSPFAATAAAATETPD
jgi:hypothetical protein